MLVSFLISIQWIQCASGVDKLILLFTQFTNCKLVIFANDNFSVHQSSMLSKVLHYTEPVFLLLTVSMVLIHRILSPLLLVVSSVCWRLAVVSMCVVTVTFAWNCSGYFSIGVLHYTNITKFTPVLPWVTLFLQFSVQILLYRCFSCDMGKSLSTIQLHTKINN